MNPIARFTKDPNAVLDYTIDWSRWLAGDTITATTWIVPMGLTQSISYFSPTTATIWLANGVIGVTYLVIGRITTGAGRIDERTIEIDVDQR